MSKRLTEIYTDASLTDIIAQAWAALMLSAAAGFIFRQGRRLVLLLFEDGVPVIHRPDWKDLLDWTREHRAELVRACLVVIKAWMQAGMPRFQDRTKGAFESWCHILGGILSVVGIQGFLENEDDFREQSDEELESWQDFAAIWHERFGLRAVLPKDLAELCMTEDLMLGLLKDGTPRSRQTQMGNLLKSSRDRVFNGLRIVMAKNARHRGHWYRLQPVESENSNSTL